MKGFKLLIVLASLSIAYNAIAQKNTIANSKGSPADYNVKVSKRALLQPMNWLDMSYEDFLGQFPNFANIPSEDKLYINQNELVRLDLNGDGSFDWVYLPFPGDPSNIKSNDSSLFTIFSRNGAIEDRMYRFPFTQIVFKKDENRKNDFISIGQKEALPPDHIAQSEPFLYQYEGPVLENDKIAFRLYFDSRHGKDVFGKTTSKLVMDKVNPNFSYHKLNDWGMDILKVGKSAGAGTLLFFNPKLNVIEHFNQIESTVYERVYTGPNLSAFRINYSDANLGGMMANVTEVMVIKAGENGYDCFAQIEGNQATGLLATGFTTYDTLRKIEKVYNVNNKNYFFVKSIPSEHNDSLAFALTVENKFLYAGLASDKKINTDQVPHSAIVVLNTEKFPWAKYNLKVFWDLHYRTKNETFMVESIYKTLPISMRLVSKIAVNGKSSLPNKAMPVKKGKAKAKTKAKKK